MYVIRCFSFFSIICIKSFYNLRVQRYNRFASEVLFFYICHYLKSDKYKNHNKPNQKKKLLLITMKKYRLLLIAAFTLFLSCSESKEPDKDISIVPCKLEENAKLKFSDFVKSIELTPLETNKGCLINTIGKIIKYKDYYYIGSASTRIEKIFVFTEDGKFLYQLDKRGSGPDEYIAIGDFDVIKDFQVAITSNDNQSMYTYDLVSDSCVFRKKLDIYPQNILFKDGYFYVLNGGTAFHPGDDFLVYKYNQEGEIVDYLFKGDELVEKVTSCTTSLKSLSAYKGDLLFTYPYSDTIYRLTNGQFVPAYLINIGDRRIPINEFKNANGILEIDKIIKEKQGIDNMLYYSFGNPISVFTFMDYKYDGYISFYNHETNQSLSATYLMDDLLFKGNRINLKAWKLPKLYENGILYYIAEPTELIEAMNDYKDRINTEEWNSFCNEHPDIVEKIHQMKEDDNPVLVKLLLKS